MANMINARKTHCDHGHEFTEENTGRTPDGYRFCKTCKREISRRVAARRRSEGRKSPRARRAARRRAGLILGLPESVWGRLHVRDCGYETPCLVWSGTIASTGYGVVGIKGRQHKVHRLVYEAVCGPMPRRDDEGKRIVSDHLCRNRACAAPTHIDPVTDAENVMRGVSFAPANAAKTHCVNGHEFTPENTGFYKGERTCLTCKRAAGRKSDAKRRGRGRASRPPKANALAKPKAASAPREPRAPKPKAPPRELLPCGTLAARLRHVRKDEPIDEACRAAHTDRMRSWRNDRTSGAKTVSETTQTGDA